MFGWVLERLRPSGLLSGRTLGVDATTLEANAALRSIVRRDDGTGYEDWLSELAQASGIETPTRADLAKLDRKRPKKGSNDDWTHPGDPGARITKMKDGRTHLAHKLEQASDMDSGAVVAVTVQTMDGGVCASMPVTLDEVGRQLSALEIEPREAVADKGYHSNATMKRLKAGGLRSYVSEPDRRTVALPDGSKLATTCLLAGGFDILAVNLFEFGHQWRFGFIRNKDLPRSRFRKYTDYQRKHLLATGVPVTWPLKPPFYGEPFTLLREIVRERRTP